MQDYNAFIQHLMMLEVCTKELFVSHDGKIVPEFIANPALYPPETDAEIHPYWFRSIFFNIDHYADERRDSGPYFTELRDLMELAESDILLFTPDQISRYLASAKQKVEWLSRFEAKAFHYHRAWLFNKLDELPSCYLESEILDYFTIKNRPRANPNERFAHTLAYTIAFRRGVLEMFIEKVNAIIKPNPKMVNGPAIEPEYDVERIKSDYAYCFVKVNELLRYALTIEPFAERANWFYQISWKIGLDTGILGSAHRMVPEKEVFSRINEGRTPIDKNGQSIKEVAWGLDYANDEEKAIARKMYFQEYYRKSKKTFLFKPRLDFDQLLSQYNTQRQTERGKRLQLGWVTGEINDRQQVINDWIAANSDRYGNPQIRRQFQNAALLIEQELEGIPVIRWELFYRTMHLDPFALLWGLVEYKRFLETEEYSTQDTPILPANNEQKGYTMAPYNDVQIQQFVRSTLAPLAGINPYNQPIMSRADFDRLITYTDHLVFTNTLPAEILPIQQTGISNEHIRYTFYRLHKQLFGTRKKRPAFMDFLHTVFAQFGGTAKTTTNSKFSIPPKSYEKDFAGYIGEAA